MDLMTMMLISGLHGSERNEFLDRMLPAMLPIPVAQRQTFTALMAEQQVRRQTRVDEQLVEEAVRAAEFRDAEQLAPFPTLQQKFNSLSATAQARIFPPVTTKTGADTTAAPRKP
jgi:hypothetical protein